VYLFGSVARRAASPRDVDVYLEWEVDPEDQRAVDDYCALQPRIATDIAEGCRTQFGLPLSVHNAYVNSPPDDAWPEIRRAAAVPVLRRGKVVVAATVARAP